MMTYWLSSKVRWESTIRVCLLHPAKPNAGEMEDVVSGIIFAGRVKGGPKPAQQEMLS